MKKVSGDEILVFFEKMGFVFESGTENEDSTQDCLAQETSSLMPFERALLDLYRQERSSSLKNFLNYLVEKRLPHLSGLGWVLRGYKIVVHDDNCLACPGRPECFFRLKDAEKKAVSAYKKRLFLLEPPVGFEPTTCCLQNSCSNQLS